MMFYLPLQPPTQSLSRKFVMYVFIQFEKKEKEKRRKQLVRVNFIKKKFVSFFFLPVEERTSLRLKKVKRREKSCPVKDGMAQAITDNRADTVISQPNTHTQIQTS